MFDMPKLEKIWLAIGTGSLVLFLLITGVMAAGMGMNPPDGMVTTIEPDKVESQAPFDNPGLKQIGPNEYKATVLSYVFGYSPNTISVPAGSTVHFEVTTKDVVHGFHIPGTPANLMLVPGHIAEYTHTFKKPGEFLFICHEYCGIGHEIMFGKIVVENNA